MATRHPLSVLTVTKVSSFRFNCRLLTIVLMTLSLVSIMTSVVDAMGYSEPPKSCQDLKCANNNPCLMTTHNGTQKGHAHCRCQGQWAGLNCQSKIILTFSSASSSHVELRVRGVMGDETAEQKLVPIESLHVKEYTVSSWNLDHNDSISGCSIMIVDNPTQWMRIDDLDVNGNYIVCVANGVGDLCALKSQLTAQQIVNQNTNCVLATTTRPALSFDKGLIIVPLAGVAFVIIVSLLSYIKRRSICVQCVLYYCCCRSCRCCRKCTPCSSPSSSRKNHNNQMRKHDSSVSGNFLIPPETDHHPEESFTFEPSPSFISDTSSSIYSGTFVPGNRSSVISGSFPTEHTTDIEERVPLSFHHNTENDYSLSTLDPSEMNGFIETNNPITNSDSNHHHIYYQENELNSYDDGFASSNQFIVKSTFYTPLPEIIESHNFDTSNFNTLSSSSSQTSSLSSTVTSTKIDTGHYVSLSSPLYNSPISSAGFLTCVNGANDTNESNYQSAQQIVKSSEENITEKCMGNRISDNSEQSSSAFENGFITRNQITSFDYENDDNVAPKPAGTFNSVPGYQTTTTSSSFNTIQNTDTTSFPPSMAILSNPRHSLTYFPFNSSMQQDNNMKHNKAALTFSDANLKNATFRRQFSHPVNGNHYARTMNIASIPLRTRHSSGYNYSTSLIEPVSGSKGFYTISKMSSYNTGLKSIDNDYVEFRTLGISNRNNNNICNENIRRRRRPIIRRRPLSYDLEYYKRFLEMEHKIYSNKNAQPNNVFDTDSSDVFTVTPPSTHDAFALATLPRSRIKRRPSILNSYMNSIIARNSSDREINSIQTSSENSEEILDHDLVFDFHKQPANCNSRFVGSDNTLDSKMSNARVLHSFLSDNKQNGVLREDTQSVYSFTDSCISKSSSSKNGSSSSSNNGSLRRKKKIRTLLSQFEKTLPPLWRQGSLSRRRRYSTDATFCDEEYFKDFISPLALDKKKRVDEAKLKKKPRPLSQPAMMFDFHNLNQNGSSVSNMLSTNGVDKCTPIKEDTNQVIFKGHPSEYSIPPFSTPEVAQNRIDDIISKDNDNVTTKYQRGLKKSGGVIRNDKESKQMRRLSSYPPDQVTRRSKEIIGPVYDICAFENDHRNLVTPFNEDNNVTSEVGVGYE